MECIIYHGDIQKPMLLESVFIEWYEINVVTMDFILLGLLNQKSTFNFGFLYN